MREGGYGRKLPTQEGREQHSGCSPSLTSRQGHLPLPSFSPDRRMGGRGGGAILINTSADGDRPCWVLKEGGGGLLSQRMERRVSLQDWHF